MPFTGQRFAVGDFLVIGLGFFISTFCSGCSGNRIYCNKGNKEYEKARDFLIKAISYYENMAMAHAKLGEIYKASKEDGLEFNS